MNDEEKLKKAFLYYINITGLWEQIKGNLAFKIDKTVKEIFPKSFVNPIDNITCDVNAVYTYFEPNSSTIIWQESANFVETHMARMGEYKVGDKVSFSQEYYDSRASEKNFSIILSISLINLLCDYFKIDREMLIANADIIISLGYEIEEGNLKLKKTTKSIEQKKMDFEQRRLELNRIAEEIDKESKLQDAILAHLIEIRKEFASVIKKDPQP